MPEGFLNKIFRVPNQGTAVAEALIRAADRSTPDDGTRAVQLMDENHRNIEDAITKLRGYHQFEGGTDDTGEYGADSGCHVSGGLLYPDVSGIYTTNTRFYVAGDGTGNPEWTGEAYGLDGTGDVRGATGPVNIGGGSSFNLSVAYIGYIGGNIPFTVSGITSGVTWNASFRGVLLAKA